ncbi:glycosyltransferase family 9 protein [Candidatus Woesearchaeota archaeon]|nr:glycosyltransferase family 9 protein [Candidatus Woesearchaeota archaeon]
MIRKIRDISRKYALWVDYIFYLIFSPFKFKKFPINIKKILVVEDLSIGDILVVVPTLRALKAKFGAQIDIKVSPNMKEVAESLPYVNKIITNFDIDKDYDLGIILHSGSFKNSYNLLRNKVKYRIGCTKVGVLTPKGFFLNKKIMPNTKEQHKIEDNLDVIRPIKVDTQNKSLEIITDKEIDKKIISLFKQNKLNKFKVVIHPGANYKSHEWVPERYIKVIQFLIDNYDASIIITGSNKDKNILEYILKQFNNPILDLCGKTNIKEFFSIIKNSDLVISVDTSAMHIAAAFNKPIIAIFGDGYPKMWYPYTENKVILFKDYSTKNIYEEDVIEAIQKLIKK